MLKSKQRLRKNKDFVRVFKQGKRHYFGGVLLSYIQNDVDQTRVGFVVSKKYSSLAVHRNKQRRILQSAMSHLYPKLKPGFDIVISYTNNDKMLLYKDARIVLTKLLTQTNIII